MAERAARLPLLGRARAIRRRPRRPRGRTSRRPPAAASMSTGCPKIWTGTMARMRRPVCLFTSSPLRRTRRSRSRCASSAAGSRPSVSQLGIDEMRDGAGMADSIGGRDECERRQQTSSFGLDALEQQRGMKRRGAVDDGDGMTGAGGGRDHLLESGDILAGRSIPSWCRCNRARVRARVRPAAAHAAPPDGSQRPERYRPLQARRAHRARRGGRQWLKNGSSGSQIVGVGAIAGQIFVLGEPGYRLLEALAKSFDAGQARRPSQELLRLGVAGPQPLDFAALRPQPDARPARFRSWRPSVRRSAARCRRSKSRTRCRC